MKASELIDALQYLIILHGDLEVQIAHEDASETATEARVEQDTIVIHDGYTA